METREFVIKSGNEYVTKTLDDIISKASQGNVDYQIKLGEIYSDFINECYDNEKAAYWYEKAAFSGDVQAQYELGIMYSDKYDPCRKKLYDFKKSIFWLKQAANSGYKSAYNLLGYMLYGDGKYSEAFYWFSKSIEVGDFSVEYLLSTMYFSGKGVLKDNVKAFLLCKSAADRGNKEALYDLSRYYRYGWGTEQDEQQSYNILLRLSKEKNPSVIFDLARYFYHPIWGKAFADNTIRKYIKYLKKAAELGEAEAQYQLGIEYMEAYGVRKDINKAIKWFVRASDQSHDFAMLELADLYLKGEYVGKNYYKAIDLLHEAVGLGNIQACYYLGICYYNGYGVVRDTITAYKLFLRSAEIGDNDSILELVNCLYNGIGVAKNKQKALEWINEISTFNNNCKGYEYAIKYDNAELLLMEGKEYFGRLRRDDVDYDDCIEVLKLYSKNDFTEAYEDLGDVYILLGNYDEAAKCFYMSHKFGSKTARDKLNKVMDSNEYGVIN